MAERRRSPRSECSGLATLTIRTGLRRGASYVGLLHDISKGGVSVLVDGQSFMRGDVVGLETEELPLLTAWVCHTTETTDGWRVGLSFHPVYTEAPEKCCEPELCRVEVNCQESEMCDE